MERLIRKLGPHPLSLLFTALFAFLFGVLIVYLCVVLGRDGPSVGLNLLVALLGALSGWAIGMFFSPIDEKDAQRLQFVGKTVGAFISGYALGKLDPFVAQQVKRAMETRFIAAPAPVATIAGGAASRSTTALHSRTRHRPI